jgi:hypothetical protein
MEGISLLLAEYGRSILENAMVPQGPPDIAIAAGDLIEIFGTLLNSDDMTFFYGFLAVVPWYVRANFMSLEPKQISCLKSDIIMCSSNEAFDLAVSHQYTNRFGEHC